MTRLALAALSLLVLVPFAPAQTPAAPAPAVPPPAAAPADNLPAPPKDFSYSIDGRRDPFMALARAKTGPLLETEGMKRPSGPAGLLVDELSVRGIVKSAGSFVAMIAGPVTGQSYTVKAGAKLFDGTVQAITASEVVILQQVTDPLSLQKQREVRKRLRTQEEGK